MSKLWQKLTKCLTCQKIVKLSTIKDSTFQTFSDRPQAHPEEWGPVSGYFWIIKNSSVIIGFKSTSK